MRKKQVKVENEETQKALNLGKLAFQSGKKCVPALDAEFNTLLFSKTRISGETIQILNSWLRGWTLENLKEVV